MLDSAVAEAMAGPAPVGRARSLGRGAFFVSRRLFFHRPGCLLLLFSHEADDIFLEILEI